ncbi:hypothetical protein Cni_G13434 [Canna indica]|uniref:Uncharacterized protein n=1 Tax=Canna indica TaxID=4628 RepID=A0AAQ3KE00_9LILI|nr:hypothetical protein Cni_G13434 [Canna indica]
MEAGAPGGAPHVFTGKSSPYISLLPQPPFISSAGQDQEPFAFEEEMLVDAMGIIVPNGLLFDDLSFFGALVSDTAGNCVAKKQTAAAVSSNGAAGGAIVKGQWTAEEDRMLVRLVKQHGVRKWSEIAKNLAGRIGKQCRERWHNHLRPDIKKDTWTEEEERQLVEAHIKYGNRWVEIAKHISGRSENSIKNHWNATKRRLNTKRKTTKRKTGGGKPCNRCPPSILHDYIRSKTTLDDFNQYSLQAPSSSLLLQGTVNTAEDSFAWIHTILEQPSSSILLSHDDDDDDDVDFLAPETFSYSSCVLNGALTSSNELAPEMDVIAQEHSKRDLDLVEMMSLQLSSSSQSSSSSSSCTDGTVRY